MTTFVGARITSELLKAQQSALVHKLICICAKDHLILAWSIYQSQISIIHNVNTSYTIYSQGLTQHAQTLQAKSELLW